MQAQQAIAIPSELSTSNSSIDDDDDTSLAHSYESSYSSHSNMSDQVKNHNKLKRQGSRSSVKDGRHPGKHTFIFYIIIILFPNCVNSRFLASA
jgi:hypothetical protein